jgi:hypothetical protein
VRARSCSLSLALALALFLPRSHSFALVLALALCDVSQTLIFIDFDQKDLDNSIEKSDNLPVPLPTMRKTLRSFDLVKEIHDLQMENLTAQIWVKKSNPTSTDEVRKGGMQTE